MGRENKKEAVAALHKEQIMTVVEKLFSEKGFNQTTIDDIAKASEYSRRTIYAYYESKDDILYHIIVKGLMVLKQDVEHVITENEDFIVQYWGICNSMKRYQMECPHSLENVSGAKTSKLDMRKLPPVVEKIFALGTDINNLLADFIEKGKEQGVVRLEVMSMPTVYILWSSITSLLTLVATKGQFIAKSFSMTENDYLDYGFKQIINSILEVRI